MEMPAILAARGWRWGSWPLGFIPPGPLNSLHATESTLHLYSNLSAESVTYQVYQVSPATAEIKISVLLSSDNIPPANAEEELVFFPPLGTTFPRCLKEFCYNEGGGNYVWDELLTFRRYLCTPVRFRIPQGSA